MNQNASKAVFAIFDEFRSRTEKLEPQILAKRISELNLSLSASDVAEVGTLIGRFFGDRGVFPVPPLLLPVISALIQDRHDKAICDPWAGIGTILAGVQEATKVRSAIAIVQNRADFELGKVLLSTAEWHLGNPLELLSSKVPELDLVVSIPPFGAKGGPPLVLQGVDGKDVELRDDLGNLILAASAARLGQQGIGIYIVTPSFFFSSRSVLRDFASRCCPCSPCLAATNRPRQERICRWRRQERTAEISEIA